MGNSLSDEYNAREVKRAEDAVLAKREAREVEILSIAKEANRLASEANSIARSQATAAWRAARYAMYAAIIATIAAVVANKNEILALIFGTP